MHQSIGFFLYLYVNYFTMARTVFDYMQAVQMVINAIPKETERIVSVNSEKIIDLNRDNQLYDKGIDSDGGLLRAYSPATVLFKRQQGRPYNRTTLFDTGDFYRGFRLKINYPTISIYSTDEKSTDLMDKYGTNIFGLITENQKKVNYEIIQPELNAYIKKYL